MTRSKILAACSALAIGTSAAASNFIDVSGTTAGTGVNSLSITQDTSLTSNTISGNGLSSGATTLPIAGPWTSISLLQYGGNDVFSGSVKAATGSTTSALSATLGVAPGSGTGNGTEGYNSESLTIGATSAPVNPQITVSLANTAGTPGAGNKNSSTDIFNVSNSGTLNYTLAVTGNSNTLANTDSAAGNATVTETLSTASSNNVNNILTTQSATTGTVLYYQLQITGATSNTVSNNVTANYSIAIGQTLTGGSNSITDRVGQTTVPGSYSETTQISGSGNTLNNTVNNGSSETLQAYIGSSNNSITNVMDGTGSLSTSLTTTGTTKVNYNLTAGTTAAPIAGGANSSVVLNNVIGAGNAAGTVSVTQSRAGDYANLTINGNGHTVGAAGIVLTQSSVNASLTYTLNASANGYSFSMHQ